ncbi:MAG: transcription elongation factor GreA [bacterium]|nr:transcription elongation factor GreA [bacterium]
MKDDKKSFYLTKEGLEELKKEYDRLSNTKRPEVVIRLARAREMGDLSENAEYTAARDELSFLDGRLAEMEDVLKNAQAISSKTGETNIVAIGSSVTVEIDGEETRYTIVGSVEAAPEKGKISDESPVGKALLGLKVGDEVEINLPSANLRCRIKKIH